ncbi:MAG: LysM peptidoglycan-binding domain-containing protein [Clostridium sp.]|jgi:LysM repeat protein|uniref:LysM peptidoglycan-binding domain-containing protein n=1 Tax=Clostridium sp. TaxID=1506 RepID=UPI0025BDE2E5|nr:LysM peptidoglycan-binding domain-containing protein [Clostridium sp.]MCH3963010.1 LysM peptidoglycan-binding domain-containing protein [Clostridium sp.]MCI1800219.1 LysM peptidoglycan-binding domain-containing protein [Clostridium sp.]MCI2202089.1 LysM peptidoglycan-binding domain-containing protein [Clostridium sp.]
MNSTALTEAVKLLNEFTTMIVPNYDVYLTNTADNDTFHFPVNPFNYSMDHDKKYNTVEIVDVGETDVPDKGTKIQKISFDTIFPREYDSYCRYQDIPSPKSVMEKLKKWQEQAQPLRLIIDGVGLNELVIIDAMPEKEEPGEIGDKYITMNFRTYKEVKVELYNPKANSSTLKNNRTPTATTKGTYVVKKGDNLWNIAKKYYGNGAKWTTIYTKNKSVVGSNENFILPGQKLVIP